MLRDELGSLNNKTGGWKEGRSKAAPPDVGVCGMDLNFSRAQNLFVSHSNN